VDLLGEAFGKGKCGRSLAHNLPFYAVILSAAKDLRLLVFVISDLFEC
jgi:hypothetical protein